MNCLFSWSRTRLNGLFLASAEALVKRVSKRIGIAIFGRAVVTYRLERIGFVICSLALVTHGPKRMGSAFRNLVSVLFPSVSAIF